MLTLRLSLKLEAWYWAYLAIVVCDLWDIQAHTCLPVWGSQFSFEGCWICVLTSTLWSGFASTKVFVENRPRSNFKAFAKPLTTAIGCFKQNSCNCGLNACFWLSKYTEGVGGRSCWWFNFIDGGSGGTGGGVESLIKSFESLFRTSSLKATLH